MKEGGGASQGPGKALLRVLAGERLETPPIWIMRQAGRYLPEYRALRSQARSFLAFCTSPELAAEATLQPIRRFGFDGAILFSDILVVPAALGWPVTFEEGRGPVLDPLRRIDELDRLKPEIAAEFLAPMGETLKILRRDLPAACTLIGFAGAPWTVASYMIEGGSGAPDFALTKRWAYKRPEEFQTLVDILVTATIDYLAMQAASGAEVLQLFDSWAGVLSETAFESWAVKPMAAIVAGLRARGVTVPIIGFPRGAGILLKDYAEKTGIDGLGLDTTVPPAWAADRLRGAKALQGNLDPQALVAGGDALRREVAHILAGFAGRPHIFNLGHGVVPETPPDHVAELIALVREGQAA